MRAKDWRGDEYRWGKDKAARLKADSLMNDAADFDATLERWEQALMARLVDLGVVQGK